MQGPVYTIYGAPSNSVGTLTLILSIWSAMGPLVGIFVGSYLIRSAQRKQWLADERVKEWRELMGGLTTSFLDIVACKKSEQTEEIIFRNTAAHVRSLEVLNNRVFIAKEVKKAALFDGWRNATDAFASDGDSTKFGTAFGELCSKIHSGARADIGSV